MNVLLRILGNTISILSVMLKNIHLNIIIGQLGHIFYKDDIKRIDIESSAKIYFSFQLKLDGIS